MTPESSPMGFRPNRRAFLSASGLAAVGTLLAADAKPMLAGANGEPEERPASKSSPASDLVNVMQGVDSVFEFSRGNTLPIAAMPFGMAHWTLQSRSDNPWMFQPGARRIQGFRCTHQLSPWLDDYGYTTILPFRGSIGFDAASRSSSYNPASARLTPYSLGVTLARYCCDAELVPTERCAILRANFESGVSSDDPGLLFDIVGEGDSFKTNGNGLEIQFKATANAGGVPANFATYYVVRFNKPHSGLQVKEAGKHRIGVVRFGSTKVVEARIGTSFISFEQAALNLRREIGDLPLETLRERAARTWNDHLNVVEIEGGTSDQQRTFYSCMYRALLFPRIWHELDEHGELRHFSAFNGRVMPGPMYADHGYWDVYRAWYPMMSILFPERLGEILEAWVNAYREGGWLPQFPAPGYRACMTGSLIDAVFADAAVKGITGFNLADAYEGMKKHATQPGDAAKGFGRSGLELYLRYGYVPADRIQQAAAETVDAAFGDFCIAQVATKLGKHEESTVFLERSRNWRNIFDSQLKFLRGKNENGTWVTPFDPFTWGSPYVEGSAWQHRWDAPHDIAGLIHEMGGNEAAVSALQEMLASPAKFNVGVYGTEIHEMSEMAAVPFGQYAHSNQPVHHLLYVFAHAGRQDRTQFWVRKVMTELYSPDAFSGDEDTGAMSAWFILSALGFYPVCPGKAEYTLGSPLFSRATVRLQGDRRLTIRATGNTAKTVYVQDVSLNGRRITGPVIDHAALSQGGVLDFNMTSRG